MFSFVFLLNIRFRILVSANMRTINDHERKVRREHSLSYTYIFLSPT